MAAEMSEAAEQLKAHAKRMEEMYPELAAYFEALVQLVESGYDVLEGAMERAERGESDTEVVARYGEMWRLRGEVKEVRKGLAKTLAQMSGDVLDVFGRVGLQNMSFENQTVYLRRFTRARLNDGVGRSEAGEQLRAVAPELVEEKYNLNSVSSWARHYLERMEAQPEDAEEVLPDEFLTVFHLESSVTPQVKS